MSWEQIGYLQWVRRHLGKVANDLTQSAVQGMSKEDFGLTGAHVEIGPKKTDGASKVREMLASRYDLPAEQVCMTAGTTMGNFAVFEAILERGDEVILEVPNYEPLYAMLKRKGITVKTVDRNFEKEWRLDFTQLERRIGRNTRAVVVTNLHNPTGVAIDPEKLNTLAQIARDYKAYVVVDEAFLDAAVAKGLRSAVQCGTNTISISSLTKAYGLGGLRVGWVATKSEPVIQRVGTIVYDYLMGAPHSPSMSIAAQALKRSDAILEKARGIIETNLKILSGWVSRHNAFKWVKPAGGTICFIKLPPGIDDMRLSEVLRDRHDTLVAPGHFFWKKGFIRVSFGGNADVLRTGLRHIQSAVDEMSHRG